MVYEDEFARVYDIVVHQTEESLAGETEIGFFRWALDQCPRPVRRILDAGCGRGRHLIPLVQAGYPMTGLDNSVEMLAGCRQRLRDRNLEADLIQADLATLSIEADYDAVICCDSVVCYFLETDQIIDALTRLRRALRPQGLLVLDIWNFLAQWPDFGKTTTFSYAGPTIQVEWQESNVYDDFTSIHRSVYAGQYVENGVTRSFRRLDNLRVMTVGEVKMYLQAAGYTDIRAYPSYDPSEFDRVTSDVMLFIALNPAEA